MIKRLVRLKNTVNKYMADIQPDRLMTCQSERKSVVSQRPSVYPVDILINIICKIPLNIIIPSPSWTSKRLPTSFLQSVQKRWKCAISNNMVVVYCITMNGTA
jgi:hypothetical protein